MYQQVVVVVKYKLQCNILFSQLVHKVKQPSKLWLLDLRALNSISLMVIPSINALSLFLPYENSNHIFLATYCQESPDD